MRLPSLICLLLYLPQAFAQPGKAKNSAFSSEVLCAELFAAIRANPAKMVMRLEEALVINESCAQELVITAIDAVNGDPALSRKIVETALELAPTKSAAIQAAVRNHKTPAATNQEIRRAMIADTPQSALLPGEEVRRAELPLITKRIPIAEVRRAEIPSSASVGTAEPLAVQMPAGPFNLMSVPKAKPVK